MARGNEKRKHPADGLLGRPYGERLSGPSPDEEKSRTRGPAAYHVPPGHAEAFERGLLALNAARIPYVVAGSHAIHVYTDAYRPSNDLDVLLEPRHVLPALETLEAEGFACHVEAPHWLAKAVRRNGEKVVIDVIYGTGNGLFRIDEEWYREAQAGLLVGVPVRYAPVEELIWHRLFISERHRFDGADILHLFLKRGSTLNWRRLLERVGEHWPLLHAYVAFFAYVYPEHAHVIPTWFTAELLTRLWKALARKGTEERVTRGTLLSLFSFEVDTSEWGFRDLRRESIARAIEDPALRPVLESRFARAHQAAVRARRSAARRGRDRGPERDRKESA